MTTEAKKGRAIANAIITVLVVVTIVIYKYSANIMRMIAHGRWYPPKDVPTLGTNDAGNPVVVMQPEFTDVADLGVEALQPLFIGMFAVTSGVLFASFVASIMERALRENAFGSWSRFAIVWSLVFLSFIYVVGSVM